jgi:Transposase, Mutator family
LSEAEFVLGVAESIGLGARCLDDLAVARADSAQEQLRGFGVPAPQTAGAWLRRFTLGHIGQLALIIAADGTKVPVGLWDGDSENGTVVTDLLADLVARGLRYEDGLLVVIDGAKALATGVKRVFGNRALVQRCVLHKRRNCASTATAQLAEVPRTATYTRDYDSKPGFMTVVSDGDVLTGAYALCPEAGEWLQQATVAIRARAPLEVMNDVI